MYRVPSHEDNSGEREKVCKERKESRTNRIPRGMLANSLDWSKFFAQNFGVLKRGSVHGVGLIIERTLMYASSAVKESDEAFAVMYKISGIEEISGLALSLPCFSVQIKHKNCKNMNSVQQQREHHH